MSSFNITNLDQHWVNAGDLGVHVLLQVLVKKFKDQVELVFGVHNLMQPSFRTRLFFKKNRWQNNVNYNQNILYIYSVSIDLKAAPYLTIVGWSSSFKSEISRIAVDGTPSSSASTLT